MNNKAPKRILALIAAAMLCMAAFPLTAYAGGGEEPQVSVVPEPTPEPVAAPNPFTPAGTGTVIDNATGEDGKEFFTIMTPDENVFYLVIDRQRETENVYFLNAVTEQDLMALAEVSAVTAPPVVEQPAAPAEPTPPPVEPEPEKDGNIGMVVIVVLVVLAGGGAAYYFKIYKPKQEQADNSEDFDDYGEYEAEDDTSSWYEDDESGGDGDK